MSATIIIVHSICSFSIYYGPISFSALSLSIEYKFDEKV